MSWSYEKAEKVCKAVLNVGIELGWIEWGEGSTETAPTPINKTSKGKAAAKPAVDVAANAAAGAPAAPSPAEPAATPATHRTMMPLCTSHAQTAPMDVKPIPAEPSACVTCIGIRDKAQTQAKGTPPSKAPTLEQAKSVADALIKARDDGLDICLDIIASLGAESLTGAEGTKQLPAEKFEEFVAKCVAAMPEDKPAPKTATARRSL